MNKCYLLVLSAILFCFSCRKKGAEGPQGPQGPLYKGTIKGIVSVYDQYGNPTFSSLQNIRVTLRGAGRVTTTDVNGFFVFDTVMSGNYSIAIEADGIASKVVNNVDIIKDTLFEELSVSQIPTFQISGMSVRISPWNDFINFGVLTSEPSRSRSVILFADTNPQVSNTTHKLDTVITIPAGQAGRNCQLTLDKFNRAGIFYGDTVYFAAYPYSVNGYSLYEDAYTGKNIYNAVGTPVLETLVMP